MEKIVEQNLQQIKHLMLLYGVERAFLFGSAAKGSMHDGSDIDFIIKFPDSMHYTTYADNYFALADALETLLKKNVELVTEKTLKNPYLIQSINRTQTAIDMTEEEQKLLTDIEQAALNIDIHLDGRRVWDEFAANITKRRAIERELEIIGEATNNLLKVNPGISVSYARKIVNLRNRVIHAYDSVDETIIWKVVVKDIPQLLLEVRQLLAQGGNVN